MGDTTQNKCHYIIENGIAIITIDNPPMNALNHIVLKDLRNSVNALIDDASVRVIIITGAGKAFVAGADINEIKVQTQKKMVQTSLKTVRKSTT
jgi:enoyl-CoA hydratase/carnithine racemase